MMVKNNEVALIDPRAVAIHEAGHAVIAYVLKIEVLSMVMNADFSGCVSTEDEPTIVESESDRDLLKKHMLVAVAGDQAERRGGYAPDNGRCAKDYEHANRLAWTLEPNRNAWALTTVAHASTGRLLANPAIWAAVEALANRLIETGQLSGEEACDTISSHLGPPGGFAPCFP